MRRTNITLTRAVLCEGTDDVVLRDGGEKALTLLATLRAKLKTMIVAHEKLRSTLVIGVSSHDKSKVFFEYGYDLGLNDSDVGTIIRNSAVVEMKKTAKQFGVGLPKNPYAKATGEALGVILFDHYRDMSRTFTPHHSEIDSHSRQRLEKIMRDISATADEITLKEVKAAIKTTSSVITELLDLEDKAEGLEELVTQKLFKQIKDRAFRSVQLDDYRSAANVIADALTNAIDAKLNQSSYTMSRRNPMWWFVVDKALRNYLNSIDIKGDIATQITHLFMLLMSDTAKSAVLLDKRAGLLNDMISTIDHAVIEKLKKLDGSKLAHEVISALSRLDDVASKNTTLDVTSIIDSFVSYISSTKLDGNVKALIKSATFGSNGSVKRIWLPVINKTFMENTGMGVLLPKSSGGDAVVNDDYDFNSIPKAVDRYVSTVNTFEDHIKLELKAISDYIFGDHSLQELKTIVERACTTGRDAAWDDVGKAFGEASWEWVAPAVAFSRMFYSGFEDIIKNLKIEIDKISEHVPEKSEAPEGSEFGRIAFAPARAGNVPPEPNTEIEDDAYNSLVNHFAGDSEVQSDIGQVLTSLVKAGKYKSILHPPKATRVYRGIAVKKEWMIRFLAAHDIELVDHEYEGSIDTNSVYVPSQAPARHDLGQNSVASSWTVSKKIALDFAKDNTARARPYVVVLTANVGENNGHFLSGDDGLYKLYGARGFQEEHEVVGIGDIKLSKVSWQTTGDLLGAKY